MHTLRIYEVSKTTRDQYLHTKLKGMKSWEIKLKDGIIAKASIAKVIWEHVFQAILLIDLEVAQNVCGHGF